MRLKFWFAFVPLMACFANPAIAHLDSNDIEFYNVPAVKTEAIPKQQTEILVPGRKAISVATIPNRNVQTFAWPQHPKLTPLVAKAKSIADAVQADSKVHAALTSKSTSVFQNSLDVHGEIMRTCLNKNPAVQHETTSE